MSSIWKHFSTFFLIVFFLFSNAVHAFPQPADFVQTLTNYYGAVGLHVSISISGRQLVIAERSYDTSQSGEYRTTAAIEVLGSYLGRRNLSLEQLNLREVRYLAIDTVNNIEVTRDDTLFDASFLSRYYRASNEQKSSMLWNQIGRNRMMQQSAPNVRP